MRCTYKGYDNDYNYRVAEISYSDEDEKTVNLLCEISDLMSERGWKIDIVGSGYACCEVDDRDDFNNFMEDWKDCKKIARKRG
jgi:hypothetical protein